jgi:hypothetical protein
LHFIAGRNKLSTVPEARGGLKSEGINCCGNEKHQPTGDVVNQRIRFHIAERQSRVKTKLKAENTEKTTRRCKVGDDKCRTGDDKCRTAG